VGILFERWYSFRPRTRILCWSMSTGVILLGVWLALARPVSLALSEFEAKRETTSAAMTALWHSEVRRPHLSTSESERVAAVPFSPLDFQTRDVRLVRWSPDARGGELTLDADWAQIPALFERFTRGGMEITAFSIEPGKSLLKLIVQVESVNAN
jgi:pilus assembly protein HofO